MQNPMGGDTSVISRGKKMLLMKKCVRTETCVDDAHPHSHTVRTVRGVSLTWHSRDKKQTASSLETNADPAPSGWARGV